MKATIEVNNRQEAAAIKASLEDPTTKALCLVIGSLKQLPTLAARRRGRTLFVLLVFDDPGLAQYVSNCDRENMVAALRETADRLERREDIER